MRAAFLAARERSVLLRLRAAERAWLDSARREAAERGSRLSAFLTARERVAEGFVRFRLRPLLVSRAACFLVRAETFLFFGGGSFTPARRALDNPIAMACLVERAPCFPSRICSISSRTNSPACVDGDLPSLSSSRTRSIVSSSGIQPCFARKSETGCARERGNRSCNLTGRLI